MARAIAIGTEHEIAVVVAPEMGAPHLGPAAAVLSTPSMIGLMEQCCLLATLPFLDQGESSEGAAVCVSHDAAARVGDAIRIRVRLASAAEGRHIWEVTALAADGRTLGAGTIERVILSAPGHAAR